MVICNNNFVCEEDVITTDNINDDGTCVSIADNICTTCESIKSVRTANAGEFNEDPIYMVFGQKRTKEENDYFWNLLTSKCSMKPPESMAQEKATFYVAEPNYLKLREDQSNILKRISTLHAQGEVTDANASSFVGSLFQIASLSNHSTFSNESDFKLSMHRVLEASNCSSRMIHYPSKLPLHIQLFFSELAEASEAKFKMVIVLLDDRPQACLEGILEQSMKVLRSSLDDISAASPTYGGKKIKKKTMKRKKCSTKRRQKKKRRKTSNDGKNN